MRSLILLIVGVCLTVFALHGCSGGDSGTEVRLSMPDDGSAPLYGEAPFPSEAWRGADGTLDSIRGLEAVLPRDSELLAAHLTELDGFGIRPLVEFPVTGPLDPASVPTLTTAVTDAAAVIDIDPDSPERGRVVPYEWRYDDATQVLRGSPLPGHVLRPGTLYAAIVTGDIHDADGDDLARASGFADLLDGEAAAPFVTTAEALAELDSDAAWSGRIAGATVFRTQTALRTLVAGRAMLDDPDLVPPAELSFPDPAVIFADPAALDSLLGVATRFEDGPRAGEERWGYSNETGMAHDHVGVIATGRLATARFRVGDDGSDLPGDETFALDADGAPVVQEIDSIPITFVLPAAPAPEAGYPVAIFGHGLGASRAAVVSFAEPLTRAGYAIVCIDFEGHGSRFLDKDEKNNLANDITEFTGEPLIPDGFGDKTGHQTSFDMLEGLRNLSGARDAIQQSVLDVAQLVLFLKRGGYDLSPLAAAYGGETPVLDASRVAYLGESFGTISGGVLTALEPEVDLFVLDVPAAGIVDLTVVNSPEMVSLLLPLLEVVFGLQLPIDRFDPAISLFQSLLDPVDPLTWAPYALRDHLTVGDRQVGPRHVVGIEVIGDEVTPNVATNAWAQAMGLEVLSPHLGMPTEMTDVASPAAANVDGQTAVLVHYSPATHGANWTSEKGELGYVPGFPHEGDNPFPRRDENLVIANPIYETLDQVIEVLDTHLAGEAPVVRSTLAPVAE